MIGKVSKKISLVFIIIILGGLGGIVADRYLFPYLSATNLFSKNEFLKKSASDVTIINKTEQIVMKEETSISKISNQSAASVVNIISYPSGEAKISAGKKVSAGGFKNGTGVIITNDGMILTYLSAINAENAKYKILTYDGGSYDAELLGIDSWSNLVFLKINAGNLPAISFGNSDDSRPGEKIVAIGNSYENYSNRYAAGLLSDFNPAYNLFSGALSSSEKLEGVFGADFNYKEFFVGGPVVDYTGQTIGIIGSKKKEDRQEFFLIPSNKIKQVIDRAIKKELDQNPVLGAYYVPLTKTYAIASGLNVEKGALVYSASGQQGLAIVAGSPAQKAGLRINDIVTRVNGQEITPEKSLSDLLYGFKKGDNIELSVLRNEEEVKIKVQL